MGNSSSESQENRRAARIRRVVEDCLRRRSAGEELSDEQVIADQADLLPELRQELSLLALMQRVAEGASASLRPAGLNRVGREQPSAVSANSFPGYEILNEIHRGGQGVVYRAIQESTKREVAIKVLKEGAFAGPRELARFEREVQILASLRHPNIVAVHESGTAAAGNFYFVMDHISGQPLDRYMKERRVDRDGSPINETLELFAKICEAVNAAHLRGVIHRDLKPANVRVDADGNPHVLDFGLAKMTAGESDPASEEPEASALTITGQFMGSLPWASPEQARGLSDLDLRTDVYSLGVILFQMLTSKFPYEVTGNIRDVMGRIMNDDPARPGALQRDINDEVDCIILKCLRKEPERRYQTAGELAREVRCFLAGEPIEAKRDSTLYVLGKSLRRHRWAVAVGLAFVVGLSVFAVYASLQADRYNRLAQQEQEARQVAEVAREKATAARDEQSRERQRAEKARDKAEAINEFVTKALVSSDPNQGGAQGFLVTDAMEQAVVLLDAGELKDQPETEAALLLTISQILNDNARSQEALRLARRALEINEQLHPGDHPAVAGSLHNVAACLRSLGRSAEALPKFET
ncbi:MAG: serine/threonine-protein kinase, partial [Planctomycetota bacterium]|nr:serine/threonine-protein kinase [Planctomycetota bacterium]